MADDINHPLNEYLLLACKYGLISLMLLTIMFAINYKCILKNKYIGSLLLAIVISSMFSYPFRYAISWITIAAILGYTLCNKENNRLGNFTPICIAVFLVSGFYILSKSIKTHYSTIQWKNAYYSILSGNRNTPLEIYSKLYRSNQTPEFVYNYASILLDLGDEKLAQSIMDKCELVNYETTMLRGRISVANQKYDIANKEFKLAHDMCPNRFKP